MQRVIREEEPAKPSTKLSTLGETLTDIARHRGCTPDLLTKAVRGDLDWIVMKALEKDRARRYETANNLADDLRRHLQHEPVLARGPSTIYRLERFLRRHRSHVVATFAIIVVATAAAVILLLWNRDRLRLAEEEASRHRNILSQARASRGKEQYAQAMKQVRSILRSRHVGSEAQLLYDGILAEGRERLAFYTRRIEADPNDAGAYSSRARCHDYLGNRASARADMRRWSAILSKELASESPRGAPRDRRRIINLPFDCQLVFSAERPVNTIPMMSVAFGQKGRCNMKVLEIPVFVMSLWGLVCSQVLTRRPRPLISHSASR